MSHYNADLAEAKERDVSPPSYDDARCQAVVPPGFSLYLGDIEECLLRATAAGEATIEAKFNNDIAAMAQSCAVVLAETRSAAALAAHLGKHISAHQRRHERRDA